MTNLVQRDRPSLLKNLVQGDLIRASGQRGKTYVCLVEKTAGGKLQTRVITTQLRIQFDRLGVSLKPRCAIDSVEPVPDSFRTALLDLDRKMRLGSDAKLTKEEIWVLFKIDSFYSAYPLGRDAPRE